MDKDGSGELDFQELKKVLRPLGMGSDGEVASLMRIIDKSGDGLVDVEEMMSFIKGGREKEEKVTESENPYDDDSFFKGGS